MEVDSRMRLIKTPGKPFRQTGGFAVGRHSSLRCPRP
jgi:hypothetical protein